MSGCRPCGRCIGPGGEACRAGRGRGQKPVSQQTALGFHCVVAARVLLGDSAEHPRAWRRVGAGCAPACRGPGWSGGPAGWGCAAGKPPHSLHCWSLALGVEFLPFGSCASIKTRLISYRFHDRIAAIRFTEGVWQRPGKLVTEFPPPVGTRRAVPTASRRQGFAVLSSIS